MQVGSKPLVIVIYYEALEYEVKDDSGINSVLNQQPVSLIAELTRPCGSVNSDP